MSTIVVMPGGFHPFHAGHASLYQSALEAFPGAEVYVAATNDTKTRPFPFAIKEKLAKVAGVADKHFVQVKSPFQPREITDQYNPAEDVLIFVRSEKDRNESPKPGGMKKDGTPAYFQPWTGKDVQPFGKQAYIAYLPTVEFGPGITSATEIRAEWPSLDEQGKLDRVMSLYPVTQKNPKLAANVVKMLDLGMGNELDETIKRVEPISKSVPIQQTVIHPVKQDVYVAPEKKTTPAVVNHIKPREVKEFAPPSSDDGGGDNRSRRIRKLLEIAIQVAKEKNIDELGMIHGMNMIAGDEFFNTAVEGILPDITDKEYMFVLQSAYKTVKQGLAEAKKKRKKKSRNRSLGRYFFPGYGYYGGSGESGEGGGDAGGEGVAEGDVVPFKQPSKTLTWDQVPRDVLLLANDWFWASEDNSGLDATIDPEGFGNGTANDVKYNAAKLQQKGWTIDFNDEYDAPRGPFNLRLTNKRGQTVLLPIEDAQDFTGWAEGTSSLNEGPFVQRITHPKKVSIYLRIGKDSRLVATDIPYEILDKYVAKVIQKYPQFKSTDFSFKETDKINEFAPPGSDDREPDEEEILRQLAAQWWNGTEQQMKKAQQTLEAMGWEIGQDESGDDDAGVFVIRAGDENGDSYIAFNHSDLSLDEGLGIPYPGTYEQDNEMTTTKGGQMRTLAIANEGNLSESLDYLEEK